MAAQEVLPADNKKVDKAGLLVVKEVVLVKEDAVDSPVADKDHPALEEVIKADKDLRAEEGNQVAREADVDLKGADKMKVLKVVPKEVAVEVLQVDRAVADKGHQASEEVNKADKARDPQAVVANPVAVEVKVAVDLKAHHKEDKVVVEAHLVDKALRTKTKAASREAVADVAVHQEEDKEDSVARARNKEAVAVVEVLRVVRKDREALVVKNRDKEVVVRVVAAAVADDHRALLLEAVDPKVAAPGLLAANKVARITSKRSGDNFVQMRL